MTPARHAVTTLSASMFGAFLGLGLPVAAVSLYSSARHFPSWFPEEAAIFGIAASFFGGVALGYHLPYFGLRKHLPAECPACGGKTWAKGMRPIRYECADCDHVEETNVSAGRSSSQIH